MISIKFWMMGSVVMVLVLVVCLLFVDVLVISDVVSDMVEISSLVVEVLVESVSEVSLVFVQLIMDYEFYQEVNFNYCCGQDGDLEVFVLWEDIFVDVQVENNVVNIVFFECFEVIDVSELIVLEQVSYVVLDYLLCFFVEFVQYDISCILFLLDSGFFFMLFYLVFLIWLCMVEEGEVWVCWVEVIDGYFEQNFEWMCQGVGDGFIQLCIIV